MIAGALAHSNRFWARFMCRGLRFMKVFGGLLMERINAAATYMALLNGSGSNTWCA